MSPLRWSKRDQHLGGAEGEKGYLKWVARNHPGHFMALYGKLVPLDVNAKVERAPFNAASATRRYRLMICQGPAWRAAIEHPHGRQYTCCNCVRS